MANAEYKQVGEWQKANRILRMLQKNLNQLSEDGLEWTGMFYAAEVKEGIESQEPGGMPFLELAQSTIDRKGSEKALVDKADMVGGVIHKMVSGTAVFVGGLRQVEHPSGDGMTMENLMAIHEEGTEDGHVQPRPFLEPIISSDTIRGKQQRGLHRYLKRRIRTRFK